MKRVKNTHNQYLKKTMTAIDNKSIWRYSVLSILMTWFLFACLGHSGGLPISKQDQVKLDNIVKKCEAYRKSMDPLKSERTEKLVSELQTMGDKLVTEIKKETRKQSNDTMIDMKSINAILCEHRMMIGELIGKQNITEALKDALLVALITSEHVEFTKQYDTIQGSTDPILAKITQRHGEFERLEADRTNSTVPEIPTRQKDQYDRSYIQDDQELCKPFKNVFDYLKKLTQAEYQLEIDPESQDSILKSLILGDINSLDALKKDDYQIVPPGVLFHTWMPLYGTAIFDGSNNVKGIDYKQRLIDEANQFDEWGIPIIIVYSKEGMEPDEVIKMEKWIDMHHNILFMNMEEDLLTWSSFDRYQNFYHEFKDFPAHFKASRYDKNKTEMQKRSAIYIDQLRLYILSDFYDLLGLAQEKAKALNKTKWIINFENVGAHSIIYSDIDNTFLARPRFTLAPSGFARCMIFQSDIFEIARRILDPKGLAYPLNLKDIAKQTQAILCSEGENTIDSTLPNFELSYLRQQSQKLCCHLMDGQIMKNAGVLRGGGSSILKSLFAPERGYFILNKKGSAFLSLALFMLEVSLDSSVSFKAFQAFCFPIFRVSELSPDIEAVQQVGQIHIGRDKSWYKNSCLLK